MATVQDWVKNHAQAIALTGAAIGIALGSYWIGYSHGRPDTPSYEPDVGMTPKGVIEGPDGRKWNYIGYEEEFPEISDVAENMSSYRPEGARSSIIYHIPESQLDAVRRQVRIIESEIRRKWGRARTNEVWRALLIDPNTGCIDPRKLHRGYGWVTERDVENIGNVIRRYEIATGRR